MRRADYRYGNHIVHMELQTALCIFHTNIDNTRLILYHLLWRKGPYVSIVDTVARMRGWTGMADSGSQDLGWQAVLRLWQGWPTLHCSISKVTKGQNIVRTTKRISLLRRRTYVYTRFPFGMCVDVKSRRWRKLLKRDTKVTPVSYTHLTLPTKA